MFCHLSPQKAYETAVRIRGDLERIMMAIRNLNGIDECSNLIEFIKTNIVDHEQISSEFQYEFAEFPKSSILPLY